MTTAGAGTRSSELTLEAPPARRIGTFLDARELPNGAVVHTDVCVVGAGAAGITIARQLGYADRRVCVLESGGLEADPQTTSLTELELAGMPIGSESRQRFYGGTTNSWYGGLATLHPIDLASRTWMEVPGWPFDESELDPWYRRAADSVGVPDLIERGRRCDEGRVGRLLVSDELSVAKVYWPKEPLRFSTLLRPGRSVGDVKIFLYANLTEIHMSEDRRRVTTLVVRTLSGRRWFIAPRMTVLACGGIENARLLLTAGPNDGRGIGNSHDRVGRYYMDHPKGEHGIVRLAEKPPRLDPRYWTARRDRFRLGVRLSDAQQRDNDLLNSYVTLSPIFDGPGVTGLKQIYIQGLRSVRRPVVSDVVAHLPEVAAFLRFRVQGRPYPRKFAIQNFMEQEPRATNRVGLSTRRDVFGMPLARLEWSLSEREHATMRSLHGALDRAVRRWGIGQVESPFLSAEGESPFMGDASHHMGTTRMGSDPATSVVDGHCRVHGVDNLWIAGSSVFPTSGYANPTLTIVALALRLADRLRRSPVP